MWIFRIALVIGVLGAVAFAEEDYEYEDEIPEPVAPRKPIIASRGIRPGLVPSKANKIPTTPVKSKPATKPVEPEPPTEVEEPIEDGENPADGAEEAVTEVPKKTIKPVVRPFRSNDDLLAALKRRRQHAQQTGKVVDKASTAPPAPASEVPHKKPSNNLNKSSNNRRARVNPKVEITPETPSTTRRSTNVRKPPSRSARPAPAPQQEEEEEEVTQASRPKFSRGSNRRT